MCPSEIEPPPPPPLPQLVEARAASAVEGTCTYTYKSCFVIGLSKSIIGNGLNKFTYIQYILYLLKLISFP